MNKHTPGPWMATFEDYRWVIECRGELGPRKALAVTAGSFPKHEANAHLIAAAPDLLEALKALTHSVDYEDLSHDDQRSAFKQARAAIAKATGGDQ